MCAVAERKSNSLTSFTIHQSAVFSLCVSRHHVPGATADLGRFPFSQKFRNFRVGEWMEQTIPGISFRNFGCTSRGWPEIPENRNNRKIPFHSAIPARAQFLRARNRTQHGGSFLCSMSVLVVFLCDRWLKYIIAPFLHRSGHSKLRLVVRKYIQVTCDKWRARFVIARQIFPPLLGLRVNAYVFSRVNVYFSHSLCF